MTVGSCVLYKRVENHWHKTPEYKELEFRWVPEGVTCLATLLAGAVPNQVDPQCVWPLRGSPNALNILRIFNKAEGSVVYASEYLFIEERHEALSIAVNPKSPALA